MIKKFFAGLIAAAAVFALFPAWQVNAAKAEEAPEPYVVDFADREAESKLIPAYVPSGAMSGGTESFSKHWKQDTSTGTLTRINDCYGSDVTGNYAALYFKDCYLRYFEMSVDVRIGDDGLEGIIFGGKDMSIRHISGANAVYFMPDPCVEVGGIDLNRAKTSSKFALKEDFYKLRVAVCEEYFRVWVDDALKIDEKFPKDLFDYGRLALFTANTEGAFGGRAEIYELDKDGTRLPFRTATLVEGITLADDTLEMEYGGEPIRLDYRISPENCTESAVRFLSENPDVATVDTKGYLHALKAGTTVVKAITEDGGYTAETVVQVTRTIPEIAGVTLNKSDETLSVGEKLYLVADYYPAEAENTGFKWSCSDTSVAIVNNGTVTALGEGECVISVRDYYGNFKAECKITVRGDAKGKESKGCKSVLGGVAAMPIVLTVFGLITRRKRNG